MRKNSISRPFSLALFILFVSGIPASTVFSQNDTPYVTTQRIIPPSPEAISLGTVGFSNVNLYTGKASYSLPIYTISQDGINFPINLSYTGGGGIKVEEIASSVGLGWSLSSTGVISRAIRGIADDEYYGDYKGYINLPPFPPPIDSNYSIYQLYARNKYDGQPDLYSLSVAGLSAQFYITRDKKVVFIEKSDLHITPVFSGYSIVAFEVKDLNGVKYYFSDLETTRTVYLDGSFSEYSPYNTTSWYLTKITSPYGKDILTFTYLSGESNQSSVELRSPHQYSLQDLYHGGDNTSWSEQFYKRPQLQKISFPSGEIDFKVNDSLRYDIGTDHALESIVVKNYTGDTIKQFHFNYSYFSSSGTIHQGQSSPTTYGNPALRLKLDSLEDISRANQKLTYQFVYDTTHFLPDRLSSFAMDHWGFFNGQTSNTDWEAKNRIKYYHQPDISTIDSSYVENGSADREPNLEYAKAGVLTKVVTPTGGEVRFNYELNSSADSSLPNTLTTSNTWYYPTSSFSTNYFSINLINEPFAYIKVQSDVTSSSYSYEYYIEDSLQTQIFYHDTLVVGNDEQQNILPPGKYCIIQKLIGSNPDTSYQYFTRLFKDDETYLANKPVGGIRIHSMQLYDPVRGTTLQRNYYYNESGDTSTASLSTGTISGVPKYGYQNIDYFTSFDPPYYGAWMATGYIREASSFYPLGVTSGSFVGYKKVTVVDSNALKTESYFTSFTDFPEMSDGYYTNPLTNEDGMFINGKWYENDPWAPTDERDFLRGKLTKQVIYKKENGAFYKIQQTENTYQFNMGIALNDHSIMLPETMDTLAGMVFIRYPDPGSGQATIDLKKYNLYTTRYDLKKTVEKQYTYQGGMDSLVMETNYEYGDSPWYRDSLYHYQPTKISKIVNTGTKLTTLYYPYDWRYGIPDTLSGETNNYKTLDTSNRIAVPVLQVITDSASGLNITSVKNTYSPLVNSILAPNLVKTKQGSAASFENRVSFNKYDTSGNLIEQQKTNDIKSVYLWDYKNSYPVAEVINADSASVAYTSFEAENKGGWSYSGTALDTVTVTGKKAYKLNGSNGLSKSGLNSSNVYILSYWTRNGSAFSVTGTQSGYPISGRSLNGWTYYEHKITGQTSISLSGTGWIDEVRFYPASAQMSTITYTPLLGISSQCDANNRITYYEYDGFGRLSIVRDQDKNIVKHIRYNYAGQAEPANYYYNVSASQSFTRNNCGTGYTGSSVTYTVAAGVYGSDISQADANKKAAADLAANGQNYANANGTCTYVCDSTTCSGVNKKCISNNCETGVKVYTDTYYDSGLHKWVCTYHYEWSDGSWSGNYIEYSNFACPV